MSVLYCTIQPRSHRACGFAAALPRLKQLTIAERLKMSWQCSIKVAARLTIGLRTKSVAGGLLSMHKKLAPTDFDCRLLAKVF